MALNTTPTGSIGKIQRWITAQKAAGKKVQPTDISSAYDAELNSLLSRRNSTRELDLSQSTLDETIRNNNMNADLTRQAINNAEDAGKTNMLTQLGTTGATTYGLSDKTWLSDAGKGLYNKVFPGTATVAAEGSPLLAGAPAAAEGILGPVTATPEVALNLLEPATYTGLQTGAEVAPAATGGSLASYLTPVGYALAAAGVRKLAGQTDRPMADRSSMGLATSAPVVAGSTGLTWAQDLLGSSNDISKAAQGLASVEERLAGRPLDKVLGMFEGKNWDLNDNAITEFNKGLNNIVGPDATKALNPIGAAYDSASKGDWTDVGLRAVDPTGILSNVFCFCEGTIISMDVGREVLIETLGLGDYLELGGQIIGIGKAFSENIYKYHGQRVDGNHAAFEKGKWIRIKDSEDATRIPGRFIVYPIVTENHRLVIGGRVYADLCETDQGWDVTEEERLVCLNSDKSNLELIFYDN